MKALRLLFLAIALVFGTAPLCAGQAAPPIVKAMADCSDLTGEGQAQHEGHGDPRSLACHSCVLSLGMLSALQTPGPQLTSSPAARAVTHLTSALIEPPTPPPRAAVSNSITTNKRR